jgi:photosynthetic reaction center cytochrome c subunit
MSRRWHGAALAALALAALGCERPPVDSIQTGYRGTGTETNFNPRLLARSMAEHKAPAPLPPAPPQDPAPDSAWKNVQVLKGLSVSEFNRTMIAMTNWVAPKQGCVYCHNPNNFASDSLYTKVVARRMIQMTHHINQEYQPHVAATGVTCYTCHAGNNVPANVWFYTGVNQALRHYLDREDVRVQSHVALKREDTNHTSIKQTEYTYSLMLNISRGLGVNCTFCHNSRQWFTWQAAGGKNRVIALRGIRMVRDLNSNYLVPLQPTWPANRLGPHGDGPKLECATCHQGAYKPLYGAQMAKDYPGLLPPPESADSYAAPAPISRTPEKRVSLLTNP